MTLEDMARWAYTNRIARHRIAENTTRCNDVRDRAHAAAYEWDALCSALWREMYGGK